MRFESYSSINCYSCGTKFKNEDACITIRSDKFESRNMEFSTDVVSKDSQAALCQVHFHRSCFLDIAGSEYTP